MPVKTGTLPLRFIAFTRKGIYNYWPNDLTLNLPVCWPLDPCRSFKHVQTTLPSPSYDSSQVDLLHFLQTILCSYTSIHSKWHFKKCNRFKNTH